MNKTPTILLPALSACLLSTLVVTALEATSQSNASIGYVVLLVLFMAMWSALHIFSLGIPTFFILCKFHLVRWWSMGIAGFLVGCLPTGLAIFFWTFNPSQSSAELWDLPTVVAHYGAPTAAGWHFVFNRAGGSGLIGAIGGIAFWLTWQRLMRSNHSNATVNLCRENPAPRAAR
ncbi:MAG: hypothetical protein ABI132_04310 [Rhodanobacteraceae bacterium]